MNHSRLAKLAVAVGTIVAIAVFERVAPLRERTRPAARRTLRNAALGVGSAAVVELVEVPLARAMARRNQLRRGGLAGLAPSRFRRIAAFLAMDYGIYLWHVATHKVPFLWRFHRIHHIDPDLDMSTALRFHTLDMLVSLPWRLLQVALAGARPEEYDGWRRFFTASVLFHHANLRLPAGWDKRLSLVITTPEMHGIHHSSTIAEMDSNWTSGLSVWDRLHGTLRDTPQQDHIVIGLDDARALEDLPLAASLLAPFRPSPPPGADPAVEKPV